MSDEYGNIYSNLSGESSTGKSMIYEYSRVLQNSNKDHKWAVLDRIRGEIAPPDIDMETLK